MWEQCVLCPQLPNCMIRSENRSDKSAVMNENFNKYNAVEKFWISPEYSSLFHNHTHNPIIITRVTISFALSRQESKNYNNKSPWHRNTNASSPFTRSFCRRCSLPKLAVVWSVPTYSSSLYSDNAGSHARTHAMQTQQPIRRKKMELKLIQIQNDRFGSMSWFTAEHTIDMGRMRVKWQMAWRWVKKKRQFDWINNNNENFECLFDVYEKLCFQSVCGSSFWLIFWLTNYVVCHSTPP